MKKKILLIVAIIAFAVVGMVPVVDALPTPDCPNACIQGGDGCWCYAWYPNQTAVYDEELMDPIG